MQNTRFGGCFAVSDNNQYEEAELATIILCVRSIIEMGCWSDLVRYCVYRIEESMEETLLEEMDEDSAVVH